MLTLDCHRYKTWNIEKQNSFIFPFAVVIFAICDPGPLEHSQNYFLGIFMLSRSLLKWNSAECHYLLLFVFLGFFFITYELKKMKKVNDTFQSILNILKWKNKGLSELIENLQIDSNAKKVEAAIASACNYLYLIAMPGMCNHVCCTFSYVLLCHAT